MGVSALLFLFFFFLISPTPWLIHAQQPYVGKATTDCGTADNSSSVLGYTCNGLTTTCQAYLTFRSQSPYNTVSSIAQLLNADPSQISQINSVIPNISSVIDTDQLVFVPVNCSCTGGGQYYQSNTSYVVQGGDTYFSIANNTFQSLSTCQALQAQNNIPATDLQIGNRLTVPLRCACPTKNQSDHNGVKYLLSYLVTWNQDVSSISAIFGVNYPTTLEANELSSSDTINALTTLLIPLQTPPTATTNCGTADNSTSVLGYTCNGLTTTCQAYLTFRSQSPYNTVSSIAQLLNADPSQISQINSVIPNISSVIDTDQLVFVPVNCSCTGGGQYYQSNTSYVVQEGDTYFSIANNTFQSLSTCQALQAQNGIPATDLQIGDRLTVPLRCACPTKNQSDHNGVKYLLSYLVTWNQDVSSISAIFGVNYTTTLEANELSSSDTINALTTLLIPLQTPPTGSEALAPPPPPPPPPSSSSSSNNNTSSTKKTWVYVVAGVLGGGGGVLLVIGGIAFCIFIRRNKKKKQAAADPIVASESFEAIEKSGGKKVEKEESSKEFLESIAAIAQSLKVYTFGELKSATDNFSPSCWIKGSVYRGTIKGDFAAIKKMDGDVSEEINVLNKISHFNLICLSGVCFNDGNWYLVYEYAMNGPLSDWIYLNNIEKKVLSWTQRIQIALDVATGLNYIHNYTSPPFVHKDLKSSNVLLDSELRAKIANFGLARSADGEEGEFALTRHIVGTKGYMAPEYLENGFISTKLDVYAFGVLLLEILTGKEVSALYGGVNGRLSDVLSPVIHDENGKENLGDFMDPSLQESYPPELAVLVAGIVESCIKNDPSARPGMAEIVQSLSRIVTSSLNWEQSKTVSGYHSFA